MKKVLFPEANNDYIRAAAKQLEDAVVCAPILEAQSLKDACFALKNNRADALVAGVDFSSREVILACRDDLGLAKEAYRDGEEKPLFSSLFVCDFASGSAEKNRYILADGATCKNPTAAQLAHIVQLVHAASLKLLDDKPRIAILSFSTFGSGGRDPSIDKTKEALAILRTESPEIIVDGEMQLDAAVNPRIAAKKGPDSPVAGRANVLITPDLNSGNILYKSFEQFAGARVAGPILLGFAQPVSDLSRGSTVEDIVFTTECLLRLAKN
ncbi:hypothetical protein IKF15_01395 [Candidatus Saccharibacteria bacterium]|nr:hypothetical protein [Candidatus Saccharibacteria bacterium]